MNLKLKNLGVLSGLVFLFIVGCNNKSKTPKLIDEHSKQQEKAEVDPDQKLI